MSVEAIGVKVSQVNDSSAIVVFPDETGVPVKSEDAAYLLSDGKSLAEPLDVFISDSPTYSDSFGNAQDALKVNFIDGPINVGVTWDNGATWDGGTFWSNT